ncbi:MAG: hypothetical protein ACR2MK_01065 [Solirubrobacteraceae bacterium]
MNDPPGASSALGIEAVEWFAEGGENLTVRVTGRWRRRRPAWSGQPTLVIEAPGRRYRFPAMPEPPSLTGAGPGTWRISFAVPAALAPDLGGRTWLQFGAVIVPLPAAVEPPRATPLPAEAAPEPPAEAGSPSEAPPAAAHAADRLPPSSELEAETTRRRAAETEGDVAELGARVEALERELADARAEAEQLAASLVVEERSRRSADQRAHAERALRLDLARQLAAGARHAERARAALGDLAAAEERVRELELELTEARRRSDEAEQVAAAAAAARERAERERLGVEHGLIARRAVAASRIPSEPPDSGVLSAVTPLPASIPSAPPIPASSAALAPSGTQALVTALRSELDIRARAEAGLRTRLVEAEARLAAREGIERRTGTALAALRDELDGLRGAFERERAAREAANTRATELELELSGQLERSQAARRAINEVLGTLESLRRPPPVPDPGPDEPDDREAAQPSGREKAAANVEAERLNRARARLREQIAPPDREADAPELSDGGLPTIAAQAAPSVPAPADETQARPWLEPVFASLARSDPDRAGRLLVDLLPAQRAVHPHPVAYDLVLGGERGCVRVTVGDGAPQVVLGDSPRAPADVDFQVFGDQAALGRLLIAGPLRRRFGRGVARVRGTRSGLDALEALVRVRLGLPALHRAGVRIEPRTILSVVARLIEPGWTTRERFSLAYETPGTETVYLLVRDGRPVEVTEVAPAGRVATSISGPVGTFELLISGRRPAQATVTGDEWPLALVRKWIKRAQSG